MSITGMKPRPRLEDLALRVGVDTSPMRTGTTNLCCLLVARYDCNVVGFCSL